MQLNKIREVWILTSELEGERASSFRQERWCRVFLDAGARLRIFNLRGAFNYSDVDCINHESLTEFRRSGIALHSGPKASVREGPGVRVMRRIKHLLLADLYLPNVIKLLINLHRVLKKREAKVVMMVSSPPFSVGVIGAILKKVHRDKIVLAVDMRDAWALHNALGGIKPLKRVIERFALRKADYVSTVSHGLASEFKRVYELDDVKVMYNVATHYLDIARPKLVDWAEVSPEIQKSRRQLVFTGSTPEGHYDLKSIIGSIVRLRQFHPHLADQLQLVFVGACDEVRRESERQKITSNDVVFISHLPHTLARSVQASAHALLFLAHFGENNAGVVSTKLFEYLCLGQPVLPLSLHRGSDVDCLLRRYCQNSINVHSAEEMMQSLVKIAQEGNEWLPRLDNVESVRELVDDYREHTHRLIA